MSKELCQHTNFIGKVDTFRFTDEEGGPVTGYQVELGVKCADCDTPLGFKGVERGISGEQPMTSFDGLTLRAPMVLAGEQ